MAKNEAGHTFLAKLGKKRLRPGGIKATQWLLQQIDLNNQSNVLEVACNMGTTTIEIAKRFKCTITAIDTDEQALTKAKNNIKRENVENLVTLQKANALQLPFDDETFDVIINEAMLTMLPHSAKDKALKEYYRVLKPGGYLLTHDISFTKPDIEDIFTQLKKIIYVNVQPLSLEGWTELSRAHHFLPTYSYGHMSLMNPIGLIRDEGILNALKIVKNGLLNSQNRPKFIEMFKFFNKHKKELYYIAMCSKKEVKK